MECLSSGFQCPSRAAYRCETIASDVTFISDGSRARILHAMKSREIEQLGETYDSAYRGGDFELISMSGHELKMKNVTESEYLVDDDPTNTIDTDGSTFCSFARSVYRVDLDGNYDIALELYTEYVFQSLSASSTYIRLRLNITADSYFNPVGLELSDETLRSVFREAFSKTWGVPPENVIYSSSIRYPPAVMCHQLPQCDVELFVYAATEWQRQNGKLWGRQIFDSIYASKDVRSSLQYNLLSENLIVEITLKERMYISPDTHHSPSCPSAPKGRISQPLANWLSPAGVDAGNNFFGFATKDTATCLKRYGVNDRDTIAYGEGYTVDFGVVLLMTRKSTEATIADFDANGNSNATSTQSLQGSGDESAAARDTVSVSLTVTACFLTVVLVHVQGLHL